ncbi:hypothetical protein SLS56_011960 [Neofusicoccum ribis]|uniref:Uncharacterized protein n=1 Tax=Neofusicoccum ribis TaxID=45134 RepID=A0ABR3SA53_9PEZI
MKGYENHDPEEIFELCDLDHTLPKIYSVLTLTYQLDESIDRIALAAQLKDGLEVTLSQYRILAGELVTDSATGKMWVKKKRDNTVRFILNWLNEPEDDTFPTFEELRSIGFPPVKMDGDLLLPTVVTQKQPLTPMGDHREDQTPILVVQANFIRGGVIMAAAIYHPTTDATGVDGFWASWSANTKALANGLPLPPFVETIFQNKSLISQATPATAQTSIAQHSLQLNKTPPTPSPGFKMPALRPVLLHFPATRIAQLKVDARPHKPGAWISTYDGIMALIWRAMARCRLDLLKPDPISSSHLLHCAGVRKSMNLPTHFFGNAMTMPKTGLPVTRLVAPDTLPEVAGLVRASIEEYKTAEMARDFCDWVAKAEHRSWIGIKLNSFLGMDTVATSIGTMTVYDVADFGFGLPKALRRPKPTVDGYVIVYPRRPTENPNEGIEVCVCLEVGCMERMLKDPELVSYAELRC